MKTSKLLITSLLAAAAMSAPAWAANDVTVSGSATADGAGTFTITSNAGDSFSATASKDSTTGLWTYKTSAMNNRHITIGTVSIDADTTLNIYTPGPSDVKFTSATQLTGSGTLILNRDQDGVAVSSIYKIESDANLSNFTGTIEVLNQKADKKNAALWLDGSAANATISLSTGAGLVVSGTNVSVAGLVGDATSSLRSQNTVRYNADNFSTNALAYAGDNSGTAARTLTIGGSGAYSFAGSVGSATNQSLLNLTKSGTGTQTLSGTTYLGNLEVSGGNLVLSGTANIAGTTTVTGGTLDLSGGTITLANAIQNSGTVTISDTTVFNLTQTGATTLINGGTIAGVDWNSLTGFNFTYNGAAVVGRGLTSSSVGVVSYDANATAKTLTWNGGDSAVWKAVTITETSPATPWLDADSAAEAFYSGDSVTFNTANATVEVSGTVDPAAMTVSAATSFTGTGTISVAVANLRTDAAMTLGENVVLDLGNISAATTVNNVVGTGTVKVVSTATGHGGTLTLENGFTGTIEYSGKFNTSNGNGNGTNNKYAKFALSNGSMWGGGSLTNDIHFLTDYQIGDSSATTITLNGNLTQADGTTLTVGGTNPTVTFGGTVALSNLKQTSGTATFNGKTTLGALTVTGGTTTFAGATNITSATVTGGTLKFDFGALNNVATFSSASTLAVNGGTAIFGYGSGGGSTITGDSFGQNLSIVVGSGAQMTIAIAKDSMKAFAGNLTLKDGAIYSKFDGGVELAGNVTLGEADSDVVYLLGTWGKLGTKISGALSGSGTAYFGKKSGNASNDTNTEVLTISGEGNSYSGEIVVGKKDADTSSDKNTELVLSTETALQYGKVNLAGSAAGNYAQLTLGSDAITIAGLSGTEFGKVALGSGVSFSTLTLNQASDTTFSGTIADGIALKKAGAGTLILSGDNSAYTGTVTLEAGTLGVGHANALGTSTVNVTGDAKLALGNGLSISNKVSVADSVTLGLSGEYGNIAFNGAITGGGTLRADASPYLTVVLGGDNSGFSGAVEVVGTTVDAAHASALGTGILKISSADPLVGTERTSGTVQASAANVALHDVSIELVRTDSSILDRKTPSDSFTVAAGATLYLDIGLLTEATLTGEEVALTIAARNAIDSFFSDVQVGTYVDDAWQISSEWKYLAGSWDVGMGTLKISAIPEPSTFGLLAGLGALALAGTRRRRRKKA